MLDVLEPGAMTVSHDDDYYYTDYYVPMIRQVKNNFCGAASIVMALMGGGKMNWTADTSITAPKQYEVAAAAGIWDPVNKKDILLDGDNQGVPIYEMRSYMQDYFPENSAGYTYQSKIFTRFSYQNIANFIATALESNTMPIIRVHEPQRLNYYPSTYSYGAHYIVISWIDFSTGEVGVMDPHIDDPYFGKHTVTLDEIEDLACDDKNLWMCVYTGTGDDPQKHYIY